MNLIYFMETDFFFFLNELLFILYTEKLKYLVFFCI